MKIKAYRAVPLLGHANTRQKSLSYDRKITLSLQAYLISFHTPKNEDISAAVGWLPCVLWKCKGGGRRRRQAWFGRNQRGSLTVEAGLVLPFFFLVCMALFCFSGIYGAQTEMAVRLGEEAKRAAMYSSGYGALPGDERQQEQAFSVVGKGMTAWAASRLKDNPWTDNLRFTGSVVDKDKICFLQ